MRLVKSKLLKLRNNIYSLVPRELLKFFFGYVAVGERYRPNPLFLSVDAVGSDYNCIFDQDTVLPFDDDSINILYSSHNLEHLPDLGANNYFKEARRILKVGGELLIEVPNCKTYYDAYADYLNGGNIHKIAELTSFSFNEEVISVVKSHQPTVSPALLEDVRAKFSVAVSCYCDPPFVGYHTPVVHTPEVFDRAFRSMSMDDFFSWLISALSPEELRSGGHCSAWYPEKLMNALKSYGFKVRLRECKDSDKLPKMLVPDRSHRSFGSFRVSAIKQGPSARV